MGRRPTVRVSPEAEAVCAHCLQIFDCRNDQKQFSSPVCYGTVGDGAKRHVWGLNHYSLCLAPPLLVSWTRVVYKTHAIDCLERLVSKMTYYASSGTLNSAHSVTHLYSSAPGHGLLFHSLRCDACTHLITVRSFTVSALRPLARLAA